MNRFIGNRDDNSLGDLISVAFDTYHDYRAAPEFNINLGGNKTDLVVTDKLNVNLSWNAVWEDERISTGRIPVGPPSCVSRSASCVITSDRRMAFGLACTPYHP